MAPDTSTLTEPATGTSNADSVSNTTPAPAPAGAADTSRIDEAIAATHAVDPDGKSDDIDPDSLEGRLRLVLPGHTYFETGAVLPGPIRSLLEKLGASDDQVVKMGAPTAVRAVFSEPRGLWQLGVGTCHSGEHGYQVVVDGPGTDITREVRTVDDVIDLIRVLGAVK